MTRAVDNGRTWIKLSAGYRLESPQVAQECARALLAHAGTAPFDWASARRGEVVSLAGLRAR